MFSSIEPEDFFDIILFYGRLRGLQPEITKTSLAFSTTENDFFDVKSDNLKVDAKDAFIKWMKDNHVQEEDVIMILSDFVSTGIKLLNDIEDTLS